MYENRTSKNLRRKKIRFLKLRFENGVFDFRSLRARHQISPNLDEDSAPPSTWPMVRRKILRRGNRQLCSKIGVTKAIRNRRRLSSNSSPRKKTEETNRNSKAFQPRMRTTQTSYWPWKLPWLIASSQIILRLSRGQCPHRQRVQDLSLPLQRVQCPLPWFPSHRTR